MRIDFVGLGGGVIALVSNSFFRCTLLHIDIRLFILLYNFDPFLNIKYSVFYQIILLLQEI